VLTRLETGHVRLAQADQPTECGLRPTDPLGGTRCTSRSNLSFVTTMAERLQAAWIKIDSARDAVEGDDGASPVLAAVVNEFARKAEKAARSPDERVAVIELEQAGDSAKVAVEADLGVSPATRDAVLEAHLTICIAKGKLDL